MLDAPVEWVPGDRFWTTLYAGIQVTLWGVLAAFAVLDTLFFGLPGVFQPVTGWPYGNATTWQSLFDLLSPWVLVALATSWFLTSRIPVSGRIGISPAGLSVRTIYRRRTVAWRDVHWLDAVRVDLSVRNGRERLTLTPYQAARIRHFFGQG